jgi:hypothetical protein
MIKLIVSTTRAHKTPSEWGRDISQFELWLSNNKNSITYHITYSPYIDNYVYSFSNEQDATLSLLTFNFLTKYNEYV